MGRYNINSNTVITDEGAYIHESFSTVGVGTTENSKITASDGAANDSFGGSVAVGSGRIVVGAYVDDVGANSNQGSAYIFDLNGTQLAKITASDGAADDNFGYSVAVGSGRIVVGAYLADVGANTNQGAVYIFDLNGTQLAKITASDGAADDRLGQSVAVGCGRIVVGAPGDESNRGSAYIFDLNGTQLAKITSSDGAASDYFGISVAIGFDRIVVGANGDNINGLFSGSAYIYNLYGNQLRKITTSPLDTPASIDYFGGSVAIGSNRIAVSAYGRGAGIVYMYDFDGNQLFKIDSPNLSASNSFGIEIKIGFNRLVVGAYKEVVGANSSQGSAYIFDLNGTQLAKINSSDGAANDQFGYSVAIGCGRIVIGAYLDDVGANSNQGSAYIFNYPEDSNTYWERVLENYKY